MENDLRNHGAMWTVDDVVFAAVSLARGMPLRDVAAHLGRKPDAVEGALERRGVYKQDSSLTRGYDYVYKWRGDSPLYALRFLRNKLNNEGRDVPPLLEEAIDELEEASTKTKEKTMNCVCERKPLFEEIALCRGRNIAYMSDEELLGVIAETESEIAKFESTKTRPKRLQRKVDELKAQLKELVDYLDKADTEK